MGEFWFLRNCRDLTVKFIIIDCFESQISFFTSSGLALVALFWPEFEQRRPRGTFFEEPALAQHGVHRFSTFPQLMEDLDFRKFLFYQESLQWHLKQEIRWFAIQK